MNNHIFIRKITFSAMLIALQIVLSRFLGIQSTYFQAGIDCIAVAIASAIFGPVWGVAVAVIADFLGVIVAGIGAYSPLLAISEIFGALIFAFFLYKKNFSAIRGTLSIVCNTVLNEIGLKPLLLLVYYSGTQNSESYLGILGLKIQSSIGMLPILLAIMIPLCMLILPKLKKMLKL